MYPTTSLREYRLIYPNTVPVPTITQLGLIGPLLELQRRKAIRATRRKTVRKRLLAVPSRALGYFRRAIKKSAPLEDAPMSKPR